VHSSPSFLVDPLFLEHFRNGDPWAFTLVYNHYSTYLKYYCFKHWHYVPEEIIDDAIAEAFYEMFKTKESFKNKDHFGGFLTLCTRNYIIDFLRKKDNKKTLHAELKYLFGHEGVYQEISEDELLKELRGGVCRLPKCERQVIVLQFYEGHSAGKVAHILNKSYQTVLNLRSRAINRLRKMLPNSSPMSMDYNICIK